MNEPCETNISELDVLMQQLQEEKRPLQNQIDKIDEKKERD